MEIAEKDTNCSEAKDYIALMKPSVMSLVVFSGIAGILMAPGHINPIIAIVATLCMTIGHGGAAAINMWYDRDIDAIMERTKKRPIVAGKILPEEALAFGVIMAFFSVFVMAVCVNYLASFLLLFIILFYVFVYTMWLKRSTPQNIVIGGLAGALPPLVGWTAVTGNIAIEPLILVMMIFLWTPPHFWALALYRSDDYRNAGIPMMPIVFGNDYTKYQILIYTLLTVACSVLPFAIGLSGTLYLATALVSGAWFTYYAVSLLKDERNRYAPRMFFFSIIYLFIIFGAMILDHYVI